MSASFLPPGASIEGIHPHHIPSKFPGRPSVLAVFLDRPGIGSSPDVAQHPDHTHDHHTEFRNAPEHASWIHHKGHRRLDGYLPRLRVRGLHRILDRQYFGSKTKGKDGETCEDGRGEEVTNASDE